MGPIGCAETSVTTLRNVPEERRCYLHRDGSLISRRVTTYTAELLLQFLPTFGEFKSLAQILQQPALIRDCVTSSSQSSESNWTGWYVVYSGANFAGRWHVETFSGVELCRIFDTFIFGIRIWTSLTFLRDTCFVFLKLATVNITDFLNVPACNVACGANVSGEPVAAIYSWNVPEDGKSRFLRIIGTSVSKYVISCLRTL